MSTSCIPRAGCSQIVSTKTWFKFWSKVNTHVSEARRSRYVRCTVPQRQRRIKLFEARAWDPKKGGGRRPSKLFTTARTRAWADLCAVHKVFVNHPPTSFGEHGVHVAELQLVALETACSVVVSVHKRGGATNDINAVTGTAETWCRIVE